MTTQRDSLGDRMKEHYEDRTRYLLPRRTYTIIRVDGKSFHTYTRDCQRPYDQGLMDDMDATAQALCENIEGAQFAYVQSDEISLLLTDFAGRQAEAWFDGNLLKMTSISASIATAHFNQARMFRLATHKTAMSPGRDDLYAVFEASPAYFDSRAFTIPDPTEVENYFIWREQDATRNSISMTAQAHFPHDQLQGKSMNEMQEMLWQEKGINWNDEPAGFKRGRCVVRETIRKDVDYIDKRTGETKTATGVERHVWRVVAPPIFTQDRDWLPALIPGYSQQATP
jgi:tRNA(His) guanylyltransferase